MLTSLLLYCFCAFYVLCFSYYHFPYLPFILTIPFLLFPPYPFRNFSARFSSSFLKPFPIVSPWLSRGSFHSPRDPRSNLQSLNFDAHSPQNLESRSPELLAALVCYIDRFGLNLRNLCSTFY